MMLALMGFEIDGNSVRLEHRFQGIGDLLPDVFLHRKALREQAHEAGELGNADDMLMRDVAYVGMPMKGQRVVFDDVLQTITQSLHERLWFSRSCSR